MVVFGAVPLLFLGCFFMLRRGFAFAPQSTRPQVYKCYRRGFDNASQLKG